MKQKKKVLLLDIDNSLNMVDPKPILKMAKEMGYPSYDMRVWKMFEDSAKDIKVEPHPIPLNYYKEFTKAYDEVIIITSRLSKWKKYTERWLHRWGFNYDKLYMRESKDFEISSGKIKENIIKKYIHSWDIPNCSAFDDDPGVIEMYKKIGIRIFKCPNGWSAGLKYHQKLNKKLEGLKLKRK